MSRAEEMLFKFFVDSQLMVAQGDLALEAFAAVWAEVRLRMLYPLMFDKVLETKELFLALAAWVPFVSLHVSLKHRSFDCLVTFWALQSVTTSGCSLVLALMLLKLRSFSERRSTSLAMKLFMAPHMLR